MNAALTLVAAGAIAVALALQPWRLLGPDGPPWAWVAAWSAVPLLWGSDGAVLQPMSGAALLVLLTGWPLAVLALLAIAIANALGGDLGWADALQRYVGLGVLPATLALAVGWATWRWLPRHLMVYIVGRGFVGTLLVAALAGAFDLVASDATTLLSMRELLLGRLMLASSEAWLTGIVVASCVACRPEWLATYSDRLYLPAR
jgi:uncharacterized membrane protein